MSNIIASNQLKTRGVKVIEKVLENENEALISVRGKEKYVVISIDDYNEFREAQLEKAIEETRAEIREGKIYNDSVKQHIERITK